MRWTGLPKDLDSRCPRRCLVTSSTSVAELFGLYTPLSGLLLNPWKVHCPCVQGRTEREYSTVWFAGFFFLLPRDINDFITFIKKSCRLHLPYSLSVCLSIYLSINLSTFLPICLSVCLTVYGLNIYIYQHNYSQIYLFKCRLIYLYPIILTIYILNFCFKNYHLCFRE